MGAPVGPTGCNAPKSVTEGGVPGTEAKLRGIQVAAGYGRFWSHLKFQDGTKPTLSAQSVNGQIGYYFNRRVSLTAVGGAILSGTMYEDGLDLDVGTGFVVSLQAAWQFIEEKGAIPFLSASLAASFSRASFDDNNAARSGYIWGTDVRIGLTVGYTFFDWWRIYLAPRFFGGPVFIDDGTSKVQGSDRYFVQAGMGMAFLLPKGLTIYVDGSPAGEQAISAGLAAFFPIK